MADQMGPLGEGLPTHLAPEWTFTTVDSHVGLQSALVRELRGAEVAPEALFTSVDPHVVDKGGLELVRLVAEIAAEIPPSCVGSLVGS